MSDARSFQRLTAITAILSGVLAIASTVLASAAVNGDFQVLLSPDSALKAGAGAANAYRWGLVASMFGYYLLLAPAAFFLGSWLKARSPSWVPLLTFFGLVYVLVGTVGMAASYSVVPGLMEAYPQASAGQREILQILNRAFSDLIYGGLSGLAVLVPGGVWWLGIGVLLRSERRILGWFTLALGIMVLITAVMAIPGPGSGATPGVAFQTLLLLWSALAPIWALWLGIDLLRRPAIEVAQEEQARGGPARARPA